MPREAVEARRSVVGNDKPCWYLQEEDVIEAEEVHQRNADRRIEIAVGERKCYDVVDRVNLQ